MSEIELIKIIEEAFRDVLLEDGISLHEAEIIHNMSHGKGTTEKHSCNTCGKPDGFFHYYSPVYHVFQSDETDLLLKFDSRSVSSFFPDFPDLKKSNSSALNDTNKNDHDSDDQQPMNQSPHGIWCNNTQEPEDNQNNDDGFEHFHLLFIEVW